MKTLITLITALLLVACSKEIDSYKYAESSFLRLCNADTLTSKADTSGDTMTFSATCNKPK